MAAQTLTERIVLHHIVTAPIEDVRKHLRSDSERQMLADLTRGVQALMDRLHKCLPNTRIPICPGSKQTVTRAAHLTAVMQLYETLMLAQRTELRKALFRVSFLNMVSELVVVPTSDTTLPSEDDVLESLADQAMLPLYVKKLEQVVQCLTRKGTFFLESQNGVPGVLLTYANGGQLRRLQRLHLILINALFEDSEDAMQDYIQRISSFPKPRPKPN